jgi:hypothetical protein
MSRTATRLILAISLALLLCTLAPPAAQAKGARAVTIYGPGIGTIHLTYTRNSKDVDLNDVADLTRINDIFNAVTHQPEQQAPSGDDLGPRYVVTYDFGIDGVTQEVYPHAPGGPRIYFPPGQDLYGEMPIAAGWASGSADLRTLLVSLGAPATASEAALSSDTGNVELAATDAAVPTGADVGGWSRWWLLGLFAACCLGWLAGFGSVHAKRRT